MWIFLGILAYILFWLVCIASYTVYYLTRVIQITSFSQVLYTLNAGAEGAEGTIGAAVTGFFGHYWFLLLLGTIVFAGYLYLCIRRRRLRKQGTELFVHKKWNRAFNATSAVCALICAAMLGMTVTSGLEAVGYQEYLDNANRVSDLYEENFVQAKDVKLQFPQQKRNLIHIVMESMESSYTSREQGGGYKEDLIPNLYAQSQTGENFTADDDSSINGALVTNNSGWTIAGLVAQSAAVPLNVGNAAFIHNMTDDIKFMPNISTLGDILQDQGYKNYFMCGSDGAYAGRSNYYIQHGGYEILDYAQAQREDAIPDDYRVWWGFEDQKLFSWAEKRLTQIAQNNQPFNFTILTADTHFTDGYLCEQCPDTFDSQYKNVINCSDHQVEKFIEWIQKQDFYKNTTIVLSGDHLSMDGSVGENCSMDYQRKAFFTVINGPKYTLNRTREFSTLDIFPTIVEALGINIEGHRLGLGTSLYADVDTLIEKLGLIAFNAELSANSNYYTDVIMSGDTTNPDADKKPEESNKPDMITQPDGETYQENQDSFSNPDYTWDAPVYEQPPVVPSYTEPVYTDPGYSAPANPVQPDPGVTDPGTGGSQAPSQPSDPTPPSVTPTPPSDPSTGSTAPEPPAPVDPPVVDPTPPSVTPTPPADQPPVTEPVVPAEPVTPSNGEPAAPSNTEPAAPSYASPEVPAAAGNAESAQ